MPTNPKTACSYPNCPELTHERYCDKHKKKTDKYYNKYQRDPNMRKRYGKDWRSIRSRYLSEHALCEECYKQNKLTGATVIHHKLSLRDGGTHEDSNLMALCKSCHSSLHAKDGSRWNKYTEQRGN